MNLIDVCPIFTTPESWYKYLVYYIQQGYLLEHWKSKQRRELCLKSESYQIMDGVLFRKNYDGVFLRCLEREDASKIVKELHDRPVRGRILGIPQLTRYLKPDITGQLCLNIPMPMQESVMYFRGVVENRQKRQDHYNLLLFQSRSNSGA